MIAASSENNEWVIVDYKTTSTRDKDPRDVANSYRMQLQIYADALQKLSGIAGERDLGISVECGRGVPRESGTGIKKLAAALTQTVDYTGIFYKKTMPIC